MTHDGLGKYLSEVIEKAPGPTADIVQTLKERQVDVVINYLPVGAEEATKWYVEQVLAAGCGMVNCIPVFIAREPYWQHRFETAGVPIVGDDIKSQVGATITHRVLTNLFRDRGVKVERTYQLNFGGNTDFYNMLERDRLQSKKESKTNAVTSQLDYDLGERNIHVGPQRLRPMARRPEVVLHPHGGPVPLATSRSTWSSSWRCGTAPTPRGWWWTPSAAARLPWTGASMGRSRLPAPTS